MRCLTLHPDLWHLRSESHAILEGPFHPAQKGYGSNRVLADEIDDRLAQQLRMQFYRRAINLNEVLADPTPLFAGNVGNSLFDWVFNRLVVSGVGMISRHKRPTTIRFLEKTPKNTLRVPMLTRLFPDALYIWNKRRAATNIDSLIAGWRIGENRIGPIKRRRFARAGYPIADQLALQDYPDKWWKFALFPGWRGSRGKTVADVAARQYYQCNYYAMTDLANIDRQQRVFSVQYEDFVQRPVEIVRRIFEWADLPPSQIAEDFAQVLPRVNDATPRARRSKEGLRYPDAVYTAMQRLPEIESLQRMMGYDG
jgi:hypothetical protein